MMNVLTLPSATKIREELLQAVLSDLLGPAGGPDEELDERNVRDRYLVGMLAPKRQELSPEEFDELAQGGVGSTEDGPADFTSPPAKTMFPSSFGMTFCVDKEAEAVRVTARWGQYLRLRSETLTKESGDPKVVWKRHPREGTSKPVPLQAGRFNWKPFPEQPEVYVQGLVRERDDHWSVTLFLVNGQEEPKKLRDQAWLFQPELVVECPKGKPIFFRRATQRDPGKLDPVTYEEEQQMAMLYRHCVEFAVGHGVSVEAEPCPGRCDRSARLRTRVVPRYELPQTTPPTAADIPALGGLVLDMKVLADTPTAGFAARLGPLAAAYEAWIADQEGQLGRPDLAAYQQAGKAALQRCRDALARVREGLGLIAGDESAAEAFRFANRAMWLQRVRTIYALARRRGEDADLARIDADPRNHSWHPFQLAFILLNLPGVTRLDHKDRTGEAQATADLLWFPTGGGKTEAYLGLTAYTLAARRLQKEVAGRGGEHGVAVLMRYTLRLLTIQQFQRAAALICACETIRRDDPARWGRTPFRLGLWVGQRTTPNTTDQSAEAVKQDRGPGKFKGGGAGGSPAQLTNCPWCGSRVNPGRDIKVETYQRGRGRTLVYCSDLKGDCPFSPRKSPDEGLPVLVVDEEVYRLLPSLVIATVDKFAQMPWNGKVGMLFGQVDAHCPRHGFCSPELACGESHPKKDRWPAVKVQPHRPLRPPDLIIQDELHLISGPLGTLVGLYETAVDRLCTWEVGGRAVRPKVIASTATIRRAGDQVHATFLRRVSVFPPQGLDVRDNFFSRQRPPSEQHPGRLYLGVCSPGRRLKVALIRVYVAFLSAGQRLYERYGKAADPWMTLVGYFNSMRELGGMRRLVDDDVKGRLRKMDQRGLARRLVDCLDELTSRKGSTEIPEVLDRLEVQFDPAVEARRKKAARGGGRDFAGLPPRPIDVLLATNMVSVGVDVNRLGLMAVGGQPKTTAEYIQATSRVGRRFPGVVCTVYNWTRPRDLSHYETFGHYHATFYKHVEALSVTPFAPGAISRGLTALLVSCLRHQGTEFNANDRAQRIDRQHPAVRAAVDLIARRAHQVGSGAAVEQQVRAELEDRIDQWLAEAQKSAGGRVLAYDDRKDGVTVGLLSRPSLEAWGDFTCLNSLREVEPTAGLVLDEREMDDDPTFVAAVSEDTDGEDGDGE
jgi:hypothetical protein